MLCHVLLLACQDVTHRAGGELVQVNAARDKQGGLRCLAGAPAQEQGAGGPGHMCGAHHMLMEGSRGEGQDGGVRLHLLHGSRPG